MFSYDFSVVFYHGKPVFLLVNAKAQFFNIYAFKVQGFYL